VVVVEVQDGAAVPAPQELDRHPIDVPAVEEDHGAVDDVHRRLVEDLLERQEPVLDRQRKLLRRQEHHRVLAELRQQPVQREQRPQGVAVGALVRGEQELLAVAQLRHHGVDHVGSDRLVDRHSRPSSSRESLIPRSGLSS
jgi:hypothetical protein